MPNVIYIEKQLASDGSGFVSDLPKDIKGEPVNSYMHGFASESPPVGRYKVWLDTETPTQANLGASWAGTLAEAVARWRVSSRILSAKGAIERVSGEQSLENLDKLPTRRSDGSIALRDNPE